MASLEIRRIQDDLVLVYKLAYGIIDIEMKQLFQFAKVGIRTRGNGLKLQAKPSGKEVRHNAFSVQTVRIWNALPNSIVAAKNLGEFKKLIDSEPTLKILKGFLKLDKYPTSSESVGVLELQN